MNIQQKKIINWGILGCGKIARKFASDLQFVKNAKLVSVASRNDVNAKNFSRDFNVLRYFNNYEDLVTDPEVDVIYVATPHSFHCEHAILCMNHKKAVLCEKPFAMNATQVKKMIGVARSEKVFLMEAMWSKFLPHYIELTSLVKKGKLGDIQSVLINFGFKPQEPVAPRMFDPKLGGGTLLDIGIYNVFFALSILGKPDEIIAHMDAASTGVDEQCAILFRYHSGKMAQLFSTFKANLPIEADINGSLGSIKVTNRFYEPSATIEYYTTTIKEKEIVTVTKSKGIGYNYEAEHVTQCLLDGLTESPVMSFNDSLLLIETLDKIRAAAGIIYPVDTILND